MAVSVHAAAKRMCERSGWSLSNLELQKLIYIAHMFYLGEHNEPLISGHFEAWDYGPVNPGLYHRVKIFGSGPVGNVFNGVEDIEDGPEAQTLDSAVDQLGGARPGKLVAITHWEDGAWAKHYAPGLHNIVIPNEDIRNEYLERKDAAQKRSKAR